MIPGAIRRRNLVEAFKMARDIDKQAGTAHVSDFAGHTLVRYVPEHVHAYTLRLRLWAADVSKGLR